MIKTLRHKGMKRYYKTGDASGLPANMLGRLRLILADLDAAEKPLDLNLPGYHLHPLKGDLKGFWAIDVTANWRVIFCFEGTDVYDVDLTDYH
ncbi:MAG: type II toxin-antitoxin system RelE/ParE family toxin [Candidatus Binatia bacterium]